MRQTIGLLAACVFAAHATQTRTWTEADYADFEKGIIHNLSVRSDGRLTLAPRFHELLDSSSPYLWALAHDSKGNVYTGGGPAARLYRIAADGSTKIVADFEGLEIHAIAIDGKDRVYAGTSPDGKVYRVVPDAKPEMFYDPKAKYIWAMAFNSRSELFVATGDQGEIHRVTPDGRGSVFFKSEEAHARSMALDAADNLIIGTEPSGLVLRISPAGQGFVLYEMAKREITAVALAKDGSVFAAGVGAKQASTPPAPTPVPAPPPPALAANPAPAAAAPIPPHTPTPSPGTPPSSGPAAIAGGSDVYCIHPGGYPEKLWTNAQDIVYAIGFDSQGRALLGTGNKGYVYRIESNSVYTALLNAPPTQITVLDSARDGRLYAATGNVGKVYEIGPGFEHEGTIESDVFDGGGFSWWGRLSFEGEARDGRVAIAGRTGNMGRPQKNWSSWSAPVTATEGAEIGSPPARFAQWKATLTLGAGARSPELDAVSLAYLPKNVAPRLEQVEITPFNYRFSPPVVAVVLPQTLTLPPLGKKGSTPPAPPAADTGASSMQRAKGYLGARWSASDDNADTLTFTVEIRGVNEKEWKPLKDKVRERYLSWDATALPDGEYMLRVTASDSPSNTADTALSTQMESDPFLIDNTPPQITGLASARNGGTLHARWRASDALSLIGKAEYSVDGGDWMPVLPVTKLSDSRQEDYDLALENLSPGEHTIAVRVEDDHENQAVAKAVVR